MSLFARDSPSFPWLFRRPTNWDHVPHCDWPREPPKCLKKSPNHHRPIFEAFWCISRAPKVPKDILGHLDACLGPQMAPNGPNTERPTGHMLKDPVQWIKLFVYKHIIHLIALCLNSCKNNWNFILQHCRVRPGRVSSLIFFVAFSKLRPWCASRQYCNI